MATQDTTTLPKYDVFSGDIGDRLWDVHALVESALAAGLEKNITVDRVLRIALDKLTRVVKDVDKSQFAYTAKEVKSWETS